MTKAVWVHPEPRHVPVSHSKGSVPAADRSWGGEGWGGGRGQAQPQSPPPPPSWRRVGVRVEVDRTLLVFATLLVVFDRMRG